LVFQNSTTDLPHCCLLRTVGGCCDYRCLPATSRCGCPRCRWSLLTQGGRDVASRCRRFAILRHRRSKLSCRGGPDDHPGGIDGPGRLRHGSLRARHVQRDPGGGRDRTDHRRVPDRCRRTRRADRGAVCDRRRSTVSDGAVCVALPVTTSTALFAHQCLVS